MNRIISISPRISHALHSAQPVVALESTIITHGMPYPSNLHTSLEVETIIEEEGAVPATIAILEGRPVIGLSRQELEFLAQRERKSVMKCSRRDLAAAIAQKEFGSTTVAATMILAQEAGIPVFATGGIGGVHRRGEKSLDISADLTELGRTPVAVVCAGVKSILDIGRTLEVLETEGVPVVGYQTKEFPAFFSRRSGYQCSVEVQSAEEAARLLRAQEELGLKSGVLFGVPNPNPAGEELEQLIQNALQLCEEQEIWGNAVTPFVLSYLHEKSGGKSLEANIALIKRNAQVAAQIAVALANERSKDFKSPQPLKYAQLSAVEEESLDDPQKKILVIGGAAIDLNCKSYVPLQLHTSNPGTAIKSYGGVGRNIAEVSARLGSAVELLTVVGKDALGAELLRYCAEECKIDVGRCRTVSSAETALYISALDVTGEMKLAIAAMDVLNHLNDHFILESQQSIHESKVVVADANLTTSALRKLAFLCKQYSKPLFFEPVSLEKSKVLLESESLADVALVAPNQQELEVLIGSSKSIQFTDEAMMEALERYTELLRSLGYKSKEAREDDPWKFEKYRYILAKFGKEGAYLCRVSSTENPEILGRKEGLQGLKIKNENGAGDTLLGSMVHAYSSGLGPKTAFNLAFQSVQYCLESESTIPSKFPAQFLQRFQVSQKAQEVQLK